MDDTPNEERAGDEAGGPPPPPFLPPPPPASLPWWRWPVARDPDDGKISGVVAGVSRAYGFDLRTTRIAVVIAGIVLPVVVLLYITAWILLPPRPEEAVPLRDALLDRRRLPLMIALAIALVVGGVGSFGSWFLFGGLPWGVALIAVGVMLWAAPKLGSRPNAGASPTATTPTTAASGAPTAATTSGWGAPTAPVPPTSPLTPGFTTTAPIPPIRTMGFPPKPQPPQPAVPPRRRIPVARFALLAALTISGIAAIGDAFDWWNASVFGFTVLSLAIVMAGIVVSAIVNRSWALIPFVLVLIPPMVFLLITQPNLDGGAGERTVVPTSAAEAGGSRSLGAGRLTIDLTELPDDSGDVSTSAEVGYGRLAVIVPDDATLVITSEIGAGHLLVDGDEVVSGLRQSDRRTIEPELAPGSAAPPTFTLDLAVGAGEIAIVRSAG